MGQIAGGRWQSWRSGEVLTGRRRETRGFIRAARRREGDSYRVAGRAGVPHAHAVFSSHGPCININVKMDGKLEFCRCNAGAEGKAAE